MAEMTPADVLEEAADLLLIHGRCTGKGMERGRFCALGAIAKVRGLEDWRGEEFAWTHLEDDAPEVVALQPALDAFRVPLRLGEDPLTTRVYDWNDNLAKDDFEVIDTFRHVAKDLRNTAVQQ